MVFEKKGNLLGNVVGLIARVRLLSRYTTMETLGGWNESTQVSQDEHNESLQKASSGVEPEKCWLNGMFTPNYKIIPNNKFIHLNIFLFYC